MAGVEPDATVWQSLTLLLQNRPGRICPLSCSPRHDPVGEDWLLAPVFAPDGETIYALSHNFSAFRWRRE